MYCSKDRDTFHVVRRRRDKKKENAGYNAQVEPRKHTQYGPGPKYRSFDRPVRRGSFRRSPAHDSGVSREFRVVRDNRVNQNSDQESKAVTQVPLMTNARGVNNVSERSSSVVSNNQRHWGGRYSQNLNGMRDIRPKMVRVRNSDTHNGHYEKKSALVSSETQVTTMKSNNLNSLAGSTVSSNDVGLYASASDPVHNPSDSRSSAAVGGKRRDLGVVGSRLQISDSTSKPSIQQNNSNVNSILGASTTESFRPMSSAPRNDRIHTTVVDSVMVSSGASRANSHFGPRLHPQSVAHQKGAVTGKEWKPKTNQKSSASSPGVIGSPVKSVSQVADTSKNPEIRTQQLHEKLSQVNIQESQNVIIAQHIRVPENDRFRLTFGAFGLDSDSEKSENNVSTFQEADSIEEPIEPSLSKKQPHFADDHVPISGSSSPSGTSSGNPSPDNKDSHGISNTADFGEMGLVHNKPSFSASKSQEHQESAEFPNISAYDQQPAYDMSYFRPSINDTVRGSGLPSNQEALPSHATNSVPASSIGMLQQQPPLAQMYPQVHVSHFANVIPYRQYLPPLYVPPMVPGFSGNPGYPHLSNGSSYVLMPGGGSHIPANSLKYGVQQFKPFPIGSPTGFGNLANPSGYAINAPGVVGGPTGLDDSSRLKYKDNNLYIPNPQAETSEVWIQNHRELGMQSNPYYNMQGQTTHPAFLQSHTGHTSFNGAGVAQSSQMQFPGMYPPQPAGIPNAHHMGGGNIGVGVAPPTPGAQVGAYQQPQMSHLNWATNF